MGTESEGVRKVLFVGLGLLVLTLASWIEVPMVPVPMTLQSLAVLLVGAWGGPRGGTGVVILWLGLAALGAPLLSGMEGGADKFVGPTAGYLVAFPLAAALAGTAAQKDGLQSPSTAWAVMLGGHALILGLGFLGLQARIGPEAAWSMGVAPFLLGMVVKSALAVWLSPRSAQSS